MLARLEDSFTRLSQFSADLAHELRTPIAILRGEAEGALTKPRTAEQYREVIESSLEELQRLSAMIDNLLFLARAETSGSFNALILMDGRQLKKSANFTKRFRRIRTSRYTVQGEGDVYAEPVLFRRALINLITNALRFTPRGAGSPSPSSAGTARATFRSPIRAVEFLRSICRTFSTASSAATPRATHTALDWASRSLNRSCKFMRATYWCKASWTRGPL